MSVPSSTAQCSGLSCCPAADNVLRVHPYVGSPGALPNLADYKLMSLIDTLGINIQDALKRWGCILECAKCLHDRDLLVSQGRKQR